MENSYLKKIHSSKVLPLVISFLQNTRSRDKALRLTGYLTKLLKIFTRNILRNLSPESLKKILRKFDLVMN